MCPPKGVQCMNVGAGLVPAQTNMDRKRVPTRGTPTSDYITEHPFEDVFVFTLYKGILV